MVAYTNHIWYSNKVKDTWLIRRQDTLDAVSASTTIPEEEVQPQANGGGCRGP